jgi:acetolactate decarboxylase
MKIIFSALAALLLCSSPPVEVKVAGEMKKIMWQADLSAHISLDTLVDKPHIYGLGPAEGIRGELLIMDSKPYWCKVDAEQPITVINEKARAAMLVYAQVPDWKQTKITDEIKDYTSLEKAVEKFAASNGQSLQEPFPFLIKGNINAASWHIIDWKEGVTHSFDNHKQFAKYGSFANEPVVLLGFYSNKHHGIFTHHTTNMHIHIMDDGKKIVGHLEEFSADANSLTILIPKN